MIKSGQRYAVDQSKKIPSTNSNTIIEVLVRGMSSGFIFIHKPAGPTSHDVVDRVRAVSGLRTVGHAGTLDPFATGVLIVGVGREATREFPKLVGLDKRYKATVRLGAISDTDDRTGRITVTPAKAGVQKQKENVDSPAQRDPVRGTAILRGNDIRDVLKKFTGKIMQVPPMYSAKKIDGKKMYELARAGKSFERSASSVEIFEIKLLTTHYPLITLNVHCGSGTYIRALARDIGEALGTGAYVEELERTAVGPFTLEESVSLELLSRENWISYLQPTSHVLGRIKK